MDVDAALVRKLAALARLELAEGEAERSVTELAVVLAHFEALAEVDTEGVPAAWSPPRPEAEAGAGEGATRPDLVAPSLPREQALADAPDPHAGSFRVPRVL